MPRRKIALTPELRTGQFAQATDVQNPNFQQLAQNLVKDYTANNYSPYKRRPAQRTEIQCEQRGNQVS